LIRKSPRRGNPLLVELPELLSDQDRG